CRPRALIGRQLERPHAPCARHSENLLLRAGNLQTLQSGEVAYAIHNNFQDLLRLPVTAKRASIARPFRFSVKRLRRCRRVKIFRVKGDSSGQQTIIWTDSAGQKGMGAVTVAPISRLIEALVCVTTPIRRTD